jgi:hypothetical protein
MKLARVNCPSLNRNTVTARRMPDNRYVPAIIGLSARQGLPFAPSVGVSLHLIRWRGDPETRVATADRSGSCLELVAPGSCLAPSEGGIFKSQCRPPGRRESRPPAAVTKSQGGRHTRRDRHGSPGAGHAGRRACLSRRGPLAARSHRSTGVEPPFEAPTAGHWRNMAEMTSMQASRDRAADVHRWMPAREGR